MAEKRRYGQFVWWQCGYSPYQLGQVNAALNLLQGLDGLQHWDKMDDLGHFSSLLGLSNSINTLSNGTSELYRDTEGDGYFEKTQWVSATDGEESANNSSWRCAA